MKKIDLGRIKYLCIKKDITLKDLSEGVGITQTNFANIFTKTSITVDNLAKIADYFGVSIGYFFGEKSTELPISELKLLLSDLQQIKTVINNAQIGIERNINYLESL